MRSKQWISFVCKPVASIDFLLKIACVKICNVLGTPDWTLECLRAEAFWAKMSFVCKPVAPFQF